MGALGHFWDHLQWHRLGLDRSHISTSECMFVVVQASRLLYFIIHFIYSLVQDMYWDQKGHRHCLGVQLSQCLLRKHV